MRTVILSMLLIASCWSTTLVAHSQVDSSQVATDLKYRTIWNWNNKELLVNVSPSAKGNRLEVFEGSKSLFNFDSELKPVALFQLQDGNLASIWHHPDGLKHIYIFGNSNGKIECLIDASSHLNPEFINRARGRITLKPENAKDGKVTRTPIVQRIIVSKTEGSEDFAPVTAETFEWSTNNQIYRRQIVSWRKRFERQPRETAAATDTKSGTDTR